jgi:hypothetical protein
VKRGESHRALFGKKGEIFVSRSQREENSVLELELEILIGGIGSSERENSREVRRELRLCGSPACTYCNQAFRLIEKNRFHCL